VKTIFKLFVAKLFCYFWLMESMNERIKRLRKSIGLKQVDIATTIGITQPSFASIESGRTKSISIELGQKIANVLNVSFNELFDVGNSHKIESFNNEIEFLKTRISELSFLVETLKNEKEHIKDHLVMQMVSAYSFETKVVASEFSSANSDEDRDIRSQLLEGIQRMYDINKEYYIRTGFLSQSDFDNHYKEMKGIYQYLPTDESDKPGLSF